MEAVGVVLILLVSICTFVVYSVGHPVDCRGVGM